MLHTLRHAPLVFKSESINPLWITVFHANGIAIGIDGSLNPDRGVTLGDLTSGKTTAPPPAASCYHHVSVPLLAPPSSCTTSLETHRIAR